MWLEMDLQIYTDMPNPTLDNNCYGSKDIQSAYKDKRLINGDMICNVEIILHWLCLPSVKDWLTSDYRLYCSFVRTHSTSDNPATAAHLVEPNCRTLWQAVRNSMVVSQVQWRRIVWHLHGRTQQWQASCLWGQPSCNNVTPSGFFFLFRRGLHRNGSDAGAIHTRNICDHSKQFLSFFT